jgi:formyltetrahydrofolate hydrolase
LSQVLVKQECKIANNKNLERQGRADFFRRTNFKQKALKKKKRKEIKANIFGEGKKHKEI